jgi:hypothetical protein
VGLETELDPRRCVALWLVAPALNGLEDSVVVGSVLSEVLLDRRELGRKKSFAGEYE